MSAASRLTAAAVALLTPTPGPVWLLASVTDDRFTVAPLASRPAKPLPFMVSAAAAPLSVSVPPVASAPEYLVLPTPLLLIWLLPLTVTVALAMLRPRWPLSCSHTLARVT